ncbi:MAG: hypothetical protein N3E42_00435 [Candidatus Bipolaricaulota bacterium]|nr:hypothetical protein [Candidatus Bipolaricaulota bacterium]
MNKKKRDLKAIASWQERIAEHHQKIELEMKQARPRRRASSGESQETLEALYAELEEEFAKVRDAMRKFQKALSSTEAYDQAWANLLVSLNVLETKARSLQELLDKIS